VLAGNYWLVDVNVFDRDRASLRIDDVEGEAISRSVVGSE
jgi:hypothetical protein